MWIAKVNIRGVNEVTQAPKIRKVELEDQTFIELAMQIEDYGDSVIEAHISRSGNGN